jgi:hypothetical protein
VIESFIEGRVRLRLSLLADTTLAERVTSELLKIRGVRKAEANLRTQGLLLEYDRTLLPMSLLMKAAPLLSRLDDLTKLPADKRLAAAVNLIRELREQLADEET